LVFDIGSIAKLINTNSKNVILATLDVFGDVELCRVSRALVIADERAIDPDVVCRVDTFEAKSQLVVLEVFWNRKRCDVAATLVIIERSMRRVYKDGKGDVGIDRPFAKALQLPHARYRDVTPS
jgi:hypothetical protein